MNAHFSRLLFLIIASVTILAMTAQARVTGATCKEHLRKGVVNNNLALQLSLYYGSPQTTQLRFLDTPRDGMNSAVLAYTEGVSTMLATCEQHCGGLQHFKCAELPKGTPKQLQIFTSTNDFLDDAELGDQSANAAPTQTVSPHSPAGSEAMSDNVARIIENAREERVMALPVIQEKPAKVNESRRGRPYIYHIQRVDDEPVQQSTEL